MEFVYVKQCLLVVEKLEGVYYLGMLMQEVLQVVYVCFNLLILVVYMEIYGMALQEVVVVGLFVLAYVGGNVFNYVDVGCNGEFCLFYIEIVFWLNKWVMQFEIFKFYFEYVCVFVLNCQCFWADVVVQFEVIKI